MLDHGCARGISLPVGLTWIFGQLENLKSKLCEMTVEGKSLLDSEVTHRGDARAIYQAEFGAILRDEEIGTLRMALLVYPVNVTGLQRGEEAFENIDAESALYQGRCFHDYVVRGDDLGALL
jgi:hypothetical protein